MVVDAHRLAAELGGKPADRKRLEATQFYDLERGFLDPFPRQRLADRLLL
jgi:hypothetical protein